MSEVERLKTAIGLVRKSEPFCGAASSEQCGKAIFAASTMKTNRLSNKPCGRGPALMIVLWCLTMSPLGSLRAFSADQPSGKQTVDVLGVEDRNHEVFGHVIEQFLLSDLSECRRYILKRKLPELGHSGCVEYEGDDTAVTVPSSGKHKVVLGTPGTSHHIEFTFANGRVRSIYSGQNLHSATYLRTRFGGLLGVFHHWQTGFTAFSRWDSVDPHGVLIPGRVDSLSTLMIEPEIIWSGLLLILLVFWLLKGKALARSAMRALRASSEVTT